MNVVIFDTPDMDPNTAFYIVSSGRRTERRAQQVGPTYSSLEQAARALSFLRRKLPRMVRLHIEQDVRPERHND